MFTENVIIDGATHAPQAFQHTTGSEPEPVISLTRLPDEPQSPEMISFGKSQDGPLMNL
jgi:hypothetical protein